MVIFCNALDPIKQHCFEIVLIFMLYLYVLEYVTFFILIVITKAKPDSPYMSTRFYAVGIKDLLIMAEHKGNCIR